MLKVKMSVKINHSAYFIYILYYIFNYLNRRLRVNNRALISLANSTSSALAMHTM